jgi:hypothetical protein
MKKKYVVSSLLAGVMVAGIVAAASAATALVPQGTTMTTIAGPGNSTATLRGLKIKSLDVYHHDGRNNTRYSSADLAGNATGGPYSLVLESSQEQTAPYGFNGDAFNFTHFATETDAEGATCEVIRWAHITGAECFGGCPSYMGFNPQTKEGIISVPVFWRGKNVAEFTVYNHLTPAAQKAFMDMYNGKSVMPSIKK